MKSDAGKVEAENSKIMIELHQRNLALVRGNMEFMHSFCPEIAFVNRIMGWDFPCFAFRCILSLVM